MNQFIQLEFPNDVLLVTYHFINWCLPVSELYLIQFAVVLPANNAWTKNIIKGTKQVGENWEVNIIAT
jgi:hypothetical protein